MATIDQQLAAMQSLLGQQSDQQIVENQTSKIDKKIVSQQEKMDSELTGDKAVDSVITTPQSEWSPYQIATANLNPDLKAKNKRYQSAYNAKSILENERVNLGQAGEMMMNMYREAIDRTESAAQSQMNANGVANAIQAGAAIIGSGMANNPAAAAQMRIAAQNNAIAQNAQIRSNADQNIANLYSGMANIPNALNSISQVNASIDATNRQNDINEKLADAQIKSYNNSGGQKVYVNKTTKDEEEKKEKDYKDMSLEELSAAAAKTMGKNLGDFTTEEIKEKDKELYDAIKNKLEEREKNNK